MKRRRFIQAVLAAPLAAVAVHAAPSIPVIDTCFTKPFLTKQYSTVLTMEMLQESYAACSIGDERPMMAYVSKSMFEAARTMGQVLDGPP